MAGPEHEDGAEQIGERNPGEDYMYSVAQDDSGCVLEHTYSAHLTYHNPDGSIDRTQRNYAPIDRIDAAAHPPIKFGYDRPNRPITKPINAKTPTVSDCVIVAFYESPAGTGRWNGRIQVICLKVYQPPTSVWLEYNGRRAPAPRINQLEASDKAQQRCLFTRQLDSFRQVHANIGTDYREALHTSVNGCLVTIIAEASVRGNDGRMVRATKIHRINCCKEEPETL